MLRPRSASGCSPHVHDTTPRFTTQMIRMYHCGETVLSRISQHRHRFRTGDGPLSFPRCWRGVSRTFFVALQLRQRPKTSRQRARTLIERHTTRSSHMFSPAPSPLLNSKAADDYKYRKCFTHCSPSSVRRKPGTHETYLLRSRDTDPASTPCECASGTLMS